ncbi:hypothetical protein QN239_24200 [Mycolicibacterium sp. Y3]
MKIFVSWSKPVSHAVARAIHQWLPLVVTSAQPWVSSEDIAKGTLGSRTIMDELAGSGQGVICVTRQNVAEPWLNFEAGALAGHSNSRVRTLLFDLQPRDITGPLWDFQHTNINDRDDMFKFVKSVNEVSDPKLSEHQISRLFDGFWPELVAELDKIRQRQQKLEVGLNSDQRNPSELLGEVIERVRAMELHQRTLGGRVTRILDRTNQLAEGVGVKPEPRYIANADFGIGEILSVGPNEATVVFGIGGGGLRLSHEKLATFARFETRREARAAFPNAAGESDDLYTDDEDSPDEVLGIRAAIPLDNHDIEPWPGWNDLDTKDSPPPPIQ